MEGTPEKNARVFRISFIRHGETVGNVQQVIQGHQDGKLTDIGIRQAALVGAALSESGHQFTDLYCSDLGRCRETLEAIRSNLSLKGVNIQFTPLIREKAGGVLEGQPLTASREAAARHPEINWADFKVEGAESWNDVCARARQFWAHVIAHHGSAAATADGIPHVLVVSHGGFIKAALDHFLVSIGRYKLRSPVKNCSISTFEVGINQGIGRSKVLALNKTEHLRNLHDKCKPEPKDSGQ